MNQNIFVYGTLMNEEILIALTGKSFVKIPARLDDHAVYRLDGKMCPGMIVEKQSIAKGFVLLNVDEKSYGIIEAWEDSEYSSESVEAVIASGTKIRCKTFIWNRAIVKEGWSNKEFRNNGLQEYIKVDIPAFIDSFNKK